MKNFSTVNQQVPMGKKNTSREWFVKGCRYDTLEPDSDQAIEAYKKSINFDNKFTDAYVNLGFIYLKRKKYDDALKCFEKVVELEPNNPETCNNLGYVYERMERIGSAKQMYNHALEIDPGNAESMLNIAQVLELEGDYHGAVQQYKKTIASFLENDENRKQFGAKARRYVMKYYSWKNIAEKYMDILRQVSQIND